MSIVVRLKGVLVEEIRRDYRFFEKSCTIPATYEEYNKTRQSPSLDVSSACLPTPLVPGTIKATKLFAAGQTAALGETSAKVVALAEGVIRIMNLTKWATTTLAILVLTGLGAGLGWGGFQLTQGDSPAPQAKAVASDDKPIPKIKVEERAAPKSDKERIVGIWRVRRGETDGKDVAPEFSPFGRFTFTKDGNLTVSALGEPKTVAYYDLVGPGKLDLGPAKNLALGIFRFESDNHLTLCVRRDKNRPTEFTADQGDQQILWYLIRLKPGEEKLTQEEIEKHKNVIPVNVTKAFGMTRSPDATEDPVLTKVTNDSPKVIRVGNIPGDARHIFVTGLSPGRARVTFTGYTSADKKDLHEEAVEFRVPADDEPLIRDGQRKDFFELVRKTAPTSK